VYVHVRAWTADCIMIAHFPIENHSEQGQFGEPPLTTMGKVQNLGNDDAIRSRRTLKFVYRLRSCGADVFEAPLVPPSTSCSFAATTVAT
jgi:hypothetical protein